MDCLHQHVQNKMKKNKFKVKYDPQNLSSYLVVFDVQINLIRLIYSMIIFDY